MEKRKREEKELRMWNVECEILNREEKITKNPKRKKKKSKTVFPPNSALYSEMKKDAVNII